MQFRKDDSNREVTAGKNLHLPMLISINHKKQLQKVTTVLETLNLNMKLTAHSTINFFAQNNPNYNLIVNTIKMF